MTPDVGFAEPVRFARVLVENGLSLADAHRTLNSLVVDGSVEVVVYPEDCQRLLSALSDLRLTVSVQVGVD